MEIAAPQFDPEDVARKRYLWIEVALVLLTCVIPWIFSSEADLYGLAGKHPPLPFVYYALRYILTSTGQSALVLFIIWRSGDAIARFGIKPFHLGWDLLGGLVLCAVFRIVYHLLWRSVYLVLGYQRFHQFAHSGVGRVYFPPSGIREYSLLIVQCACSGFMQELVMRAYLIARFEELFNSTLAAFLSSTLLFAFYHGYQGYLGVMDAVVFGLMTASYFCLFRRVAPLAIAHGINNVIAIGNISWL